MYFTLFIWLSMHTLCALRRTNSQWRVGIHRQRVRLVTVVNEVRLTIQASRRCCILLVKPLSHTWYIFHSSKGRGKGRGHRCFAIIHPKRVCIRMTEKPRRIKIVLTLCILVCSFFPFGR